MIETIFIILAGLFSVSVIFFLIQYGLKLQDLRIKEKERKELEQRTKEHQNKLACGYKYYEWRGEETWVYRYTYTQEVHRREKRLTSGAGYFKSEDDLRNCLNAEWITLTWFREL